MGESRERKIKRGDIYLANLDPALGSEEGKERRVLIVSNDIGNSNPRNTVVIAVPITGEVSEKRKRMPMYVELKKTKENGQTYDEALIDCFQIRVLSIPDRLSTYMGTVSEDVLKKVDSAIEVCLQLKTCPSCKTVLMPNKKHCVKCKHILVEICKGCLKEVNTAHKYCPDCGRKRGE